MFAVREIREISLFYLCWLLTFSFPHVHLDQNLDSLLVDKRNGLYIKAKSKEGEKAACVVDKEFLLCIEMTNLPSTWPIVNASYLRDT